MTQLCAVLESLRSSFALAGDAEITLEANPEDLDPERLLGYACAGVNRLTIGVQADDDGRRRGGASVRGGGRIPGRARLRALRDFQFRAPRAQEPSQREVLDRSGIPGIRAVRAFVRRGQALGERQG